MREFFPRQMSQQEKQEQCIIDGVMCPDISSTTTNISLNNDFIQSDDNDDDDDEKEVEENTYLVRKIFIIQACFCV